MTDLGVFRWKVVPVHRNGLLVAMPCRGSVFMGPFAAAAAAPPRPAASERPSSSFMQISRFNCLAGERAGCAVPYLLSLFQAGSRLKG